MTVAFKEKTRSPKKPEPTIKPKKIPERFVYEVIDGEVFYRKGYRDVLEKRKKIEEIMGSSGLQSYLVGIILKFLYRNIDEKKFTTLSSELGNNLSLKNNISHDIAIFDRKSVAAELKEVKYIKTPPLISIEVDVKADVENSTQMDYIQKKTNKLLEFGVEKVFWILSQQRLIMVCEKEKDWVLIPFEKSFTVIESISVNLDQLLKEEEKLSEE
jgi:Uma2 family endonuclease